MDARAFLEALAAGEPIGQATTAVVAHPDDETIGMGARLNRFANLRMIQVTDGAPRDMGDARRAGFVTAQAYAAARARELDGALCALEAAPERIVYGLPDQGAAERLPALIDRLANDLSRCEVVLTHPYEGGHPDHDACAVAVQLACARLGDRAPARFEFAGYHQLDGRHVSQRFWPDPAYPSVAAVLSPADRNRKARAFAAYASQASIMANFFPDQEAYRAAPTYDAARPPPPGAWLYDGFGFAMKGWAWLARTAEALEAERSASPLAPAAAIAESAAVGTASTQYSRR